LYPRFGHVSVFQAQDCLHFNAVKAYQPHDSNRVFTISQKCIFNVHQITTSSGKFNIFLARTRTKIPLKMQQNAISSKKFDFGGEDLLAFSPNLFSRWRKVPHTSPVARTTKLSGSARLSPRILARFTPLLMGRKKL